MAKSKYIDRAALLNSLANTKTLAEAFSAIQAAPAVDVVEVVRCKDCAYMDMAYLYCDRIHDVTDGNGYCSNGRIIK